MSAHKPIRIYMASLILGFNTLYRLFCFFKPFPMVGKGLSAFKNDYNTKFSRSIIFEIFFLTAKFTLVKFYHVHACMSACKPDKPRIVP